MKTSLQLELRTSQSLEVVQDVFMEELSRVVEGIENGDVGAQYHRLCVLRDCVKELVYDDVLDGLASDISKKTLDIESKELSLSDLEKELELLKEWYGEKESSSEKASRDINSLWEEYSKFNYCSLFVFESTGFDIFMNELSNDGDLMSMLTTWRNAVEEMSSMDKVGELLLDGRFEEVVAGLKYSFPYEKINFSVIDDYMLMFKGERKFGFSDVALLTDKFLYEIEKIAEFCDSVHVSLSDERFNDLRRNIESVALVWGTRLHINEVENELKKTNGKIVSLEKKIASLVNEIEVEGKLLDDLSKQVKDKIYLTLNDVL